MADRILVDTSAWIDALRRDGNPAVRSSVRAATAEGRAVFCDLVLLELWNGAHGPGEQRVLRELERDLKRSPLLLPSGKPPPNWRGPVARRELQHLLPIFLLQPAPNITSWRSSITTRTLTTSRALAGNTAIRRPGAFSKS